VCIRTLDERSFVRSGLPVHSVTDVAASLDDGGAVRSVSNALRCLAIGITDATFPENLTSNGGALSISLDGLAAHLPLPASLELVVVPLFCNDFDALEIIETLGTAGFRATLRVVAPKLPNRQVVLRELRAHAVRQGITLEMVEQT
jgi:hypothetical protein